ASAACTEYWVALPGETCSDIETLFGLTSDEFVALNPSVGTDCANGIVEYDEYCVKGTVDTTTSTTTSTSSTTAVATTTSVAITSTTLVTSIITSTTSSSGSAPSPTQSGLISTCDSYYLVVSGDTCYDISATYSITLDDFYSWNPAVGDDCSGLDYGYYVCVGVPGASTTSSTTISTTTTSTTTTAIATGPTPEQTGIISTCDGYYLVVSGDTCYDIAATYGITLDEFYSWNPAVGDDCSGLDYGYYVCISVPGAATTTAITSTTSTTSTTTTASVTGPTPEQTGIISTCDSYYLVVSGDTCYDISATYGITLDDFYSWNPAVGDDCSGLDYGYYVCVGV
ncbi:hypothetical protein BX600DRAFT_356684, partial [Xylariales sp. PMI_506]